MTMSDTGALFKKRQLKFTMEKEKLECKSRRMGNWRLVFFLVATAVTVLAFLYTNKWYGYIVLLSAAAIFTGLILIHERINQGATHAAHMARVNQRCRQRLSGEWVHFADQGREFLNPGHQYSRDLDLFGANSVFQWLNTTHTYHGRMYLKNLLENPDRDMESIGQRQQAVQELAAKMEFCQQLQARAMAGGDDYLKDPEPLFVFAEDKERLCSGGGWRYIIYVLPAVTLTAIVMSLVIASFPWHIPLTLFALQFAINVGTGKQVNGMLDAIFSNKEKISIYQNLLELLEKQQFESASLASVKAGLFRQGQPASQQIGKLDQIAGAVAFKNNPVVYFILNNLIFWDFHCLMALERWKAGSGAQLRQWVHHIGMVEGLACLAMMAQLDPGWCFPRFQADPPLTVTAGNLGHPLIPARQRVHNDINLEDQIAVITGSNMSGKTTLLRTIGVNLVLAYAGAPVCAAEFRCSVMDIYTSMRVEDDLSSGISTFYAELLRIKLIIDFSKTRRNLLFLIDEVFRGTNSQDRVIGARNVILNLNLPWVIGLISTHDYELCDLEKSHQRIENYHFIEHYRDGTINFDYLLKPGPCKTSNAKYLMQMAGIELLD